MAQRQKRAWGRWAIAVFAWGSVAFMALAYGGERAEGRADAPLLIGLGLIALHAVAVGIRHRRPVASMAAAVLGSAGILLVAPEIVIPVTGYLLLGTFTSATGPRRSVPALFALMGAAAVTAGAVAAGDTLFAIALCVGVWALGEAARSRRDAIAEGSRRAVGEEQARIARELHDVIAHSVSVIVVQAAAARDVFDSHPERARAALEAIEGSGREAMTELRRLLGAVRPGDEAPTSPQPGLRKLDELVAPFRLAGLEVTVERDGVSNLPPGVDLSAYRLVQEALTNTLRHADARRVEVRLERRGDEIEVEVTDDGRGASVGSEGGHGLLGMRERVALMGGSIETGPVPDGGFRVRANLPVGWS